jgi:hypothetical protein
VHDERDEDALADQEDGDDSPTMLPEGDIVALAEMDLKRIFEQVPQRQEHRHTSMIVVCHINLTIGR